jgi:hypothetical protein
MSSNQILFSHIHSPHEYCGGEKFEVEILKDLHILSILKCENAVMCV